MIQTGLIKGAHNDLLTDACYDFYGQRLATCSLDQRIKIWKLDEISGTWEPEDEWKAHDAAVSKISWAHPEFGSIIASASFDRTVKVWEQASTFIAESPRVGVNGNGAQRQSSPPGQGGASTAWVERACLVDAKGTVRAVEFSPNHFGLKLAAISSDNTLRIYECLEQPSLTSWQLSEEVDINALPSNAPFYTTQGHSVALATPTQTNAPHDGASASLVAQALQQQSQSGAQTAQARPGTGHREADGGWCISWCKDRYWGEVIAAGCGTSGVIKVIQLSPSRRPVTVVALDPGTVHPATAEGSAESETPAPYAITSVAWAPSCGRSYHLIATGGRDGHVRIWRVKPGSEEEDEDAEGETEDNKWSGSIVADFDDHKSPVGRVEWNITGTVLSSAGNDGRIRLWKATTGSVWRPAGSISVEEADAEPGSADTDVDMDNASRRRD